MAEDNTRYIPQERLLTQREGDYGELTPEDYETSWSDYRRALVSGGAGVVSGLAGGAEYLTGGALGGDTRRYFGEISDDQIKAMSPVGRRAIQAEFLPEEGEASVFDNFASSLGLKTVSALPSLVSSIVPAGLAVRALQGASLGTRALAGAVTTRGTAGLMAGGDVAGQIYSAVEKIEDKDLQEKSDVYAGYRSMMSEADARRLYNQDVAKAAPAIAALISSALGGAESQAISRYAGKTAAAGFFRGVGRGAGAEATQEAAESGVGELLAQLALTDQNLAQMNWQKILSKGLEGATIGGIMGGGVGGISGIGGRPDAGTLTATSDPEAIKKLTEAEQAPETESQGVVPPKGYGTGTAPAPAEDPTAGNPQSAPSGSERQYPKGKSPSFTIDTVRSRLEAQGIEFPENRLSEINDRIAKIRRMKKGERGSQFAALLDDLYAIGGAEGEVAPGVSISAGPDAAQVAAMNAATPVQKVQGQSAAEDLTKVGDAGKAIADNLYSMLWEKVQVGDVNENRRPSALLQAAKVVRDAGGLTTQEQFRAFGTEYANINTKGKEFQASMRDLVSRYLPSQTSATPVQKVQAAPSVMAPPTPPPVADALGNLTTPRAPAPPPVPAPARGPKVPTPVATAVGRRPAQAPVDTGTNLQQPSADLLAEQEELISGQRAVQMFPTNTAPLDLPEGMKKTKTRRGIFHYNPNATLPDGRKVTEGLIQQLSAKGRENELLGLGDRSKQEVAAAAPSEGGVTVVSEMTPEGARARSAATTVADAERQAQAMRETAAPENNVVIEPSEQALASRVTPPGPRVLEDVSEAGQAARAAQAEADAAAAARVAEEKKAILEKAKADEKAEAVKGKVGREGSLRKLSDDQREVMKEVEAVASDAFRKFSPTPIEDTFFVDEDASKLSDQDVDKAKASMVARLKAMVKAYDDGIRGLKETYKGVKSAEVIKLLNPAERGSKQADEIVFILRARHFVSKREKTKSGGAFKTFADFAAKELQYRGGRESAAEERALETAELARKAKIPGLAADKVEEGPVTSQVEALVDTGLSPEDRVIASEEAPELRTEAEVYAEGRERPKLFKARAAAAAAEAAVTSQEGKFKVSKRPTFAEGRPTVAGKVSLKPKAAAAVAVAQKTEVKAAPTATLGSMVSDANALLKQSAVNEYTGGGYKFVYRKGSDELYLVRLEDGGEILIAEDASQKPINVLMRDMQRGIQTAGVDVDLREASLRGELEGGVSQGTAQRTDVIESSNVPMDAGWADAYAGLDPDRNIIYSDDTIALMSARAINGKTIYIPIHRTAGYAKVDIDKFAGKIFTKEQTDRLKAAKKADVELREANRPDNAIRFPNGEYIVPDRTIRLADALNGLDLSGLSDTFSIIRDRVIRDVKDVPVHIVSPAEIAKAAGRSTDLGFYSYTDATGEHILIRNDLSTDSNIHTVVHEAVHALVIRSMRNNVTLNNLAVAVADEVTAYWKSKNGIDIRDMPFARYAYTHVDEFMAEAWGNKEFQNLLAKTPISPTLAARLGIADWRKSTMWDAVIKFVQRTLKLPNDAVSALEAVIRVTDEAATARATLPAATGQGAPLQSANITAQGIIGSSVDRKNAFTSWVKRSWVKIIPSTGIRQQYSDTIIGPALKRVIDSIVSTAPRARQLKAEGDKLATRAADLSNQFKTEFGSLTQIMEEARMLDVTVEGQNFFEKNPKTQAIKYWQGKARLSNLRSRFSVLPPELKQLYRDMAQFYRDSHNYITKASVTSILEGLQLRQTRGKAKGNALTDQQIDELTQRVMDQEMTAADKVLLGETIYTALENAAAFHRVRGDYFPLMRYGNHLVITTDRIKDTMGGKLEKPDTVLFRNKSNTAARNAAENFVANSELKDLSVRKVYFDNATNTELANEDEAKSYNDVDVGYRVVMQTKGVYSFETGTAAEAFSRTNPEGHDQISKPEIRIGSEYPTQAMSGTQVASLISAIDSRVASKDITSGQGELLKSIINQASIRMLGGNRIASRRLKSQKVIGASSDVSRNLLQYNAAAASHIAVAENAPVIRDGLTEMSDILKTYSGNDRAQLLSVVDEVKARVNEGIIDPNAPGWLMKDIMTYAFMARLFSPAYTILQGMQPFMVTIPALGSRYGNLAASAEVGRAYSDIGFGDVALQGVVNTARAVKQTFKASLLNTDDIVGSMRKKLSASPDGADVLRMMDEAIRLGAIDGNAGIEATSAAAEGRGKYGQTLAGVDRIARQLPQMMEAVNRSVSGVAAYRLARKNGKTHEQATQYAIDTIQNTQGDYSAANSPRFFNNPILRPALMFKKYALMVTYLLGDMAYRAFNGATPEEKRIAIKQIMNIVGVQILVAGAFSLPGLELFKVAFLLMSAMGLSDGWDEQEDKLRKLLDDSVGKSLGEMISSGLLSRAFGNGVDLSQRLSLADMWLFGEPKSDSSESMQAYMFRQAVGAPGGYLLDVRDAFILATEGELGKAFGKFLPVKFLGDFAKAAHGYSEREYQVPEKRNVSGLGEAAFNVLGFRTGRQAELSRDRNIARREKQDKQKEFDKLMKQWRTARNKGDMAKSIARNREWNANLQKNEFRLRLPVKPRELRTAQ